MTILSEARERLLRAIVAQVPIDRIAEIHFFQPIKQGGVETGVAVVAAWQESEIVADDALAPAAVESSEVEALDDAAYAEEAAPREPRPTVYTARYRLTLKGPDRGKWETNVVAEAEAPLVTVEAVVRGVQRRAGDAEDPVRISGDELRGVLPEPQNPAA